jgi:hypothetical protein
MAFDYSIDYWDLNAQTFLNIQASLVFVGSRLSEYVSQQSVQHVKKLVLNPF